GADFKDALRADGSGKHAQERADLRVDQRQFLCGTSAGDVLEYRIHEMIEIGQIALDGTRDDLTHNEGRLYMRHTKIIATVGPASDSDTMLDALVAAGADIFRLNFSHGTQKSHRTTLAGIRGAAQRANREVAVLQDLSGPKIRTGMLESARPLHLRPGDRLRIATGDFVGGPGRISTTFAGLARSVH